MIVTCVYVRVKPGTSDKFIVATSANHLESVKEPGNLRFDLIQQAEDACQFMIYEAYLSDKSNEYTDALAMEGLKAIKTSLIRSYINGEDIEARSGMAFAALTSGICLAEKDLGLICRNTEIKNNPVKLNLDDLKEIVISRIK